MFNSEHIANQNYTYSDKEIKDSSNSLIVPKCHYLMFKTIYCLLMVTIPVITKQL